MARQHATPLMIAANGAAAVALAPLADAAGGHMFSEAAIQDLVQAHPGCLPISEIDPMFVDPVPICTELNVPGAGAIDNFMITSSGLPVLVECKLWRNPEGRREVVGQILDYAARLSRWTASDLQREVSRRLKRDGNPLFDLVRQAGHEVDEIAFIDAVTLNLKRGRFLLLIVGDGIREGVEAIAEYLQVHAGLHFTLGLVEMPVYAGPDGSRLVVPRVLVRTHLIPRTVVAAPEGMVVLDRTVPADDHGEDAAPDALTLDRIRFWEDVLRDLVLDDPDQPIPKVSRQGYVSFMLPAPSGSCWLTVFRNVAQNRVGVFLSYSRASIGERAVLRILDEDWTDIGSELGADATRITDKIGRTLVQDERAGGSLVGDPGRTEAIAWLRERVNDFVTVLRPRIRAAVADIAGE